MLILAQQENGNIAFSIVSTREYVPRDLAPGRHVAPRARGDVTRSTAAPRRWHAPFLDSGPCQIGSIFPQNGIEFFDYAQYCASIQTRSGFRCALNQWYSRE